MASITITGDDELLAILKSLNEFQRWARQPLEESIDALFGRVKTYPPPKPTYQRTYTLQTSIAKEIIAQPNGLQGRVFSTGANQGHGQYEQYVKVREFQAEVHQGWWPTTEDDLEAERGTFESNFQAAAEKVLNG